MDSVSLPLYVTAFTTIIQIFVYISLGALADHGSHRKNFLITTTVISAASQIAILSVLSASMLWLALILMVLAGVFSGLSYVFYNAYLPLLTRFSPTVMEAYNSSEKGMDKNSQRLYVLKIYERIGAEISSKGVVYGAISSTIISVLVYLVVQFFGSSVYSYDY